MTDQNTYLAYTENTFVGVSPLRLVVALYEGAIDAVRQGKRCFGSGDIMGRGLAVTKAAAILSELITSLDMEKGGEISLNLKKLYDYMQQRVLAAHLRRDVTPLNEVEGLLVQLLEAWNTIAEQSMTEPAATSLQIEDYGELIVENAHEEEVTYTGYFLDSGSSALGHAYSF